MNSIDTLKGWAIPIATDTAFSIVILSFFNKKLIPQTLRAFIIGFSLMDDAIALLILAIFYTKSSSIIAILFSAILTILLFLLNRFKITNSFYYLGIGIILWIAMVEAGIHGTLSGVDVALAIPIQIYKKTNIYFNNLRDVLHPMVYFLILPLFSFINSGIPFDNFNINILKQPLSLGVIWGLFIGKQLGVFLFPYVMVKLKYCSLPANVSWKEFYGIAIIGGIGFTLSLFIGDLTFEANAPNYVMRVSVIIGSLLAAIYGVGYLRFLSNKNQTL